MSILCKIQNSHTHFIDFCLHMWCDCLCMVFLNTKLTSSWNWLFAPEIFAQDETDVNMTLITLQNNVADSQHLLLQSYVALLTLTNAAYFSVIAVGQRCVANRWRSSCSPQLGSILTAIALHYSIKLSIEKWQLRTNQTRQVEKCGNIFSHQNRCYQRCQKVLINISFLFQLFALMVFH